MKKDPENGKERFKRATGIGILVFTAVGCVLGLLVQKYDSRALLVAFGITVYSFPLWLVVMFVRGRREDRRRAEERGETEEYDRFRRERRIWMAILIAASLVYTVLRFTTDSQLVQGIALFVSGVAFPVWCVHVIVRAVKPEGEREPPDRKKRFRRAKSIGSLLFSLAFLLVVVLKTGTGSPAADIAAIVLTGAAFPAWIAATITIGNRLDAETRFSASEERMIKKTGWGSRIKSVIRLLFLVEGAELPLITLLGLLVSALSGESHFPTLSVAAPIVGCAAWAAWIADSIRRGSRPFDDPQN